MTETMKERIGAMSLPAAGTIREAMQAINRGRLGVALLIEPETNRFAGLVTDGDLRRALLGGLGLESPLSEVSRPTPKTARVGTSPEEAAAYFNEAVRVIPLLDEADRVVDLAIMDQRLYLPVAEPMMDERELRYVTECILTGWVSSAGKFVTRFEEMFAQFCGRRHAIATSNGTTALHLTLVALDIGPGDEVIVPTLTFIATANVVVYTGAKPVFVDSEPTTWNIDPVRLEEAITPRTRAIIPVHLYGHPADMDPILALAEQHNLAVIEDAAEAHGASYKGRPVGQLGDMGAFSFYGNKIVTTGEGGMVVTDRSDLAEKIRQLRDHGMSPDRRYWHSMLGYNYRMTNLQAALGVAQMEKIETLLAAKRRIAQTYNEILQDVPGIVLPPAEAWAENVYWLYSILIEADRFGHERDELRAYLRDQEIDSRPFFPPLHMQPIYNTGQQLPVAEHLARAGLNLPSAVGLKSEDIRRVAQAIVNFQG